MMLSFFLRADATATILSQAPPGCYCRDPNGKTTAPFSSVVE
jgi:hypothetical protein